MNDARHDHTPKHEQAGGIADIDGVVLESAFYHKLYHAAMRDKNDKKLAPLFDPETNRGAMIRLRTLQHMIAIHLQMCLAREVAHMKRNSTTDYDQMEQISKLMKRYSMSRPPDLNIENT